MKRGLPSMTALLTVLAVAGYQNRDKLAAMLGGAGGRRSGPPGEGGQRGGTFAGPAAAAGGAGIGAILSSGIQEILERFRQAGHGEAAESWVARGPNQDISADQLEQAIGRETLDALSRQTGLSQQEILARLTRELPSAVDKYTPEGRVPEA